MTILCLILMIFSLAVLAAFQMLRDRTAREIKELNRAIYSHKWLYKDVKSKIINVKQESEDQINTLLRGIDKRQENIDSLVLENQELMEVNISNQALIDDLTDQLRDYKDGDFIDTSTLCNIHDDIHLNVGNVNEKAQNLLISNKDLNLTVEDLNSIHGDLDLFVVSVEDAALALLSEVEEIKAQLFYLNSLL